MTRAAAKKKPPEDIVEIFDDVEQRSDEWFQMRVGIPTASRFHIIMASGKDGGESVSRARLLDIMAAEIISGIPAESFMSKPMERGVMMEPEALRDFASKNWADLRRVGFVRRSIHDPLGGALVVGCSPDALIGDDGVLQVKTLQPDHLVRLVDSGRMPGEHRAQIQGELWVTGRRHGILKIFYEGFPASPEFKFERDEDYIGQIRNAVEIFAHDLRQLVKRVRAKGGIR